MHGVTMKFIDAPTTFACARLAQVLCSDAAVSQHHDIQDVGSSLIERLISVQIILASLQL